MELDALALADYLTRRVVVYPNERDEAVLTLTPENALELARDLRAAARLLGCTHCKKARKP